ncbi:antirestriction protein ArdA [Pyruvatibacter mobilis]|uniref:Antirestriction protein ArdA n=1 Tax=Pyruvatibacter mobilis TaxID=1712261 RepID=A0A845Q7E0_9HYPH|nr:antirestriction protein ArdA [Pyruvatibacter mobilis]NBG94513.1 antirestriction protein ArdA [Pyruvatibacter mobilis]QJD74033.1 antirestriction protein ArdA [Pyruvatibacter mobilis]GGD03537.1 antirestriction protein ArdA [Pyruvatibacter mobilis]
MSDLRVYVADLAAYNEGRLLGRWFDLADYAGDAEGLNDDIDAMLAENGRGDEWAIHDYDGAFPLEIRSSENPSLDGLAEYAEAVAEVERDMGMSDATRLVAAYLDEIGGDICNVAQNIAENYRGTYDSLAEFAEELTEDTSEIPDHLQYYIDWDKMGRDMEIGGDITSVNIGGELHIFWNH